MKKIKKRFVVIGVCLILGFILMLYLSGLISQLLNNYDIWIQSGGIGGGETMTPVNWDPSICFSNTFTVAGFRAFVILAALGGGIFAAVKLHDKFDGKERDERNFAKSGKGTYGTASWMTDEEMKVLDVNNNIDQAEGVILGEYRGKCVSIPKDTLLNRHVAVFGASGTMKTRAVIRNAMLQAIKQNESVVVTDPKGELYADTAELYRQNGYEVKVYNLVNPEHSDSWNCMSDLGGDTLLAQVLTNVIIGNTSSAKGDHFWDNGEGNLLKALILYVAMDRTLNAESKHLAAVYKLLTQYNEGQLTAMFEKLPLNHPARAPFRLFSQSSDTVRAGIILGLGTRLQVLQNKSVQEILDKSDIDLTLPAKQKCAFFIIISDQDTTMAFLSSLFFSIMFIKLTRYADSQPTRCCNVPVNLVLDEFNNIGRLGSSADGSDFARSLSVFRSRNIRVMLATQSLGQLQNRYPNNLWSEIIGNCDIQLMLGCTDQTTAEFFSARSGEMSIEVNSTMTTRKTLAIAQLIPQYRHTEGQGRRKLLTPDEVLRLPHDELLCVIRACNILKLKKLDYLRHPLAGSIIKSSIFDYNPRPAPEPQQFVPSTDTIPVASNTPQKLYASAKPPKKF